MNVKTDTISVLESEKQIQATHLVFSLDFTATCTTLVPADVFYGRGQSILDEREKIKRRTLALRRPALLTVRPR